MSDRDEVRAAFEAWCPWDLTRSKRNPDEYKYDHAHDSWRAWQAAHAAGRAEERERVLGILRHDSWCQREAEAKVMGCEYDAENDEIIARAEQEQEGGEG